MVDIIMNFLDPAYTDSRYHAIMLVVFLALWANVGTLGSTVQADTNFVCRLGLRHRAALK